MGKIDIRLAHGFELGEVWVEGTRYVPEQRAAFEAGRERGRRELELAWALFVALGGLSPSWAEEVARTTVGEGRDSENEWGDRWWAAVIAAWEAQHEGKDLTMEAAREMRELQERERRTT